MNDARASDVVIDVHGINKHFGENHVVKDLALTVQRGEIFGFLGPNGSGKTTSIRMLCGLLTPDSGEGTCLGYDIVRETKQIKRHVGYMTQRFSFWEDLTIRENLRFIARMYGMTDGQEKVEQALTHLGLAQRGNQLAGTLSGGWKQRLALSCAMMHGPKILYLDEPTAGIDPVARRKLWDLLFELSGQGITFFVTTHYMDEAERCGHLAYIYYGRLIADGTPDTLREIPEVSPPGTQRFEITTKDVTTALRRARTLPFMRSATIFGRSIHALMQDSITRPELQRELENVGIHADEIRPLMPDLEDVFVELTYRRQAEMEVGKA